MQYTAQGHCTNYCTVIEADTYSEHCQTFKMKHLQKEYNAWMQCASRNLLGQEGVGEEEHYDKHFVKNTRIRGHAGKHLGKFSWR